MRIVFAIILLIGVAVVVSANISFGEQNLDATEIIEVKTACSECHTRPHYSDASQVHSRHSRLKCSTCHTEGPPVVNFSACLTCHGTPEYESPSELHEIHASTNCSRCHRTTLKTTEKIHSGLVWLGIGAVIFTIAVVSFNFVILNGKRLKKK